jgi:hypothetical protein
VAYQSGSYQAITTTNGCSDTSSSISVVNNPLPATPSISRNANVLSTNATAGIQWYYNGNIIAGATSSTINALTLGNGSAANPSLSFVGDATTGLYLAASNQLGFAVNGLNAGTLTPTGLLMPVGINGGAF